MSDEEIYFEYIRRWPHSLTRMYIDTDDESMMKELIPKMGNALSKNEPLDDSVFDLPDGMEI